MQALRGAPTPKPQLMRADRPPIPAESLRPLTVEALSQSTRGLPRLINRIAHYALTAAAAKGARTVTTEHLEHAVAELRL